MRSVSKLLQATVCSKKSSYLVSPSRLDLDIAEVSRSSNIVLECGQLAVRDLVYIGGGATARAECFYELNGCFTMQMHRV